MPVPRSDGVQRRSLLRDDVYAALRRAIVDGTLVPGERLRDTELERWLGVSRTPIREALLRLERAGLVIARPGRSTTVAPLNHRATMAAQDVAAALHELAVRTALPHLSADDLDEMAAANARFAAALTDADPDRAIAADDSFHAVAVRVADNPILASQLDQVTPLLRRVERLRFSSLAGRGSVAQHQRVIDLCRASDEAAAIVTRENWQTLASLAALEAADPSGLLRSDPGPPDADRSADTLLAHDPTGDPDGTR